MKNLLNSDEMQTVSSPAPRHERRSFAWLSIAIVVLAAFICGVVYLNSQHFRDWVRARVVNQLEEVTGGRVEIAQFQWQLAKLAFEARDITIHGTEAPGEVPYAHADRLRVHAKILSLLRHEVGLRLLEVDRPIVHIIVYPDGGTNQPTPKKVNNNSGQPTQQLFESSINHAELHDGKLIVNQMQWPLNGQADQVEASMEYATGKKRYGGTVNIGALNVQYGRYLPEKASVALEYSLFANDLQINSLKLSAANSVLQGSGNISDFRHPSAEFTYQATVDGRLVAHIITLPELKRGAMDVHGSATYQKGVFESSGKLVVRNLEYRTRGFRIPDLDAAADFRIDEKKLLLTHLVTRLLGGVGKGDLTIDNWSSGPDQRAKGGPEQVGSIRLQLASLPVGLAASAFNFGDVDFTRLNMAGMGEGTLNIGWRGTPSRSMLQMALDVIPPSQAAQGQLPVSGRLVGTYDAGRGVLNFDPLNLDLPGIRLSAIGTFGSKSDTAQLSLAINDLTRLQPLLAATRQQDSPIAKLGGKLSFEGKLGGKLDAPSFNGRLQLSDFTFPLDSVLLQTTLPEPITAGFRQLRPTVLHLESASGIVQYSQDQITVHDGLLQRQGAQVNFDLNAHLTNGQLADSDPVTAHLVLHNAQLADLQQIAGYNYPVTGLLDANISLGGTRGNPDGAGHLQLRNAMAYDEPFRTASADLRFRNQETQIEGLHLVHNGAQINGSGAFNLKTRKFHMQAAGTNFELSNIKRLTALKIKTAGTMDFNISGSGGIDQPIINADAHIHNLVVNGQRAGDANLMAVTTGDTMRINARSNFQTAGLTLDGSIKLRDLLPANLTAHFSNFDFMPYVESSVEGVTGKSSVAGTLTLQGPLRRPEDLVVVAEIPQFTAEMQGVHLHNAEPIKFSMMNQVIRIDSLHLAGDDTQFTATGTVNLKEERQLRLRADGRLNLKLVQSLNPDVNSSGTVDFNVRVNGEVTKPTLQGQVQINNGSLNFIDFPNGLSNINGSLVFNEDRLQVQSLTAKTGGGDVQIGGFATYSPTVSFNLTFQGSEIRLRYPQGVSSTANLDLKLTGSENNSILSGDITVLKFGLNNQFDFASAMARNNQATPSVGSTPLSNMHLNVHIVSTPELQIQSSLAKLSGNVDLNVRGTAVNPVVLGRLNLTEGQLNFNGATYRLERGDITFLNPARTEPTIDVEATTRVRDYDITLGFTGQPSHGLKTSYRSDPPLQPSDIVSLLAFGRTREDSAVVANQSSTMTESVSNAILGSAINSAVSNRVQRLFGVSRIKIAPDIGSTQTNPTAQVTIEQQVSNKVTITYVTSLTQASQQSIFLEYNFNREVSLIAGRDQYGVVSFDVRVRHRKR